VIGVKLEISSNEDDLIDDKMMFKKAQKDIYGHKMLLNVF